MTIDERLEKIEQEWLPKIETLLGRLIDRQQVKDWYTTSEASRVLGKAEFTVREWCRQGRVYAEKRKSGRGKFPAWVISHTEICRFQREGLLPLLTSS